MNNLLLVPTERKVVVHIVYSDSLIAEVTIRQGAKQPNREAIDFLNELTAADSTYQFYQIILQWCTSLGENGGIYEQFDE